MNSEIVLYQADDLPERITVRLEDETVWLNRQQLALLFGRDIKTIGKHINNVFSEGELPKSSTVAKFATVQNEGGRRVERKLEYYNLDVIISVGYRVKSKQGTQFRIWATNVLRNYLLKGYALNQRMNRIENTVETLADKVQKIDFQIKSKDLPQKGIFYDGQVFDAYNFVADIIRKAKTSVILIDNYIDDSVFTLFTKRKKGVACTCYTQKLTKSLQLDLKKHNQQYPPIELNVLNYDRVINFDRL